VEIKGLYMAMSGAQSGGTMTVRMLSLHGNLDLDIDGVEGLFNFTGSPTINQAIVDIGSSSSGATIRGSVAGVTFAPGWAGDTGARGIIVRGTGTLTIGAPPLRLERGNYSAAPAGASEIVYVATSNAPNVRVRNNVWKTTPAPTTLTGLVTATGKQLGTGYDCIATFTQGSGTSITAIDYSTDGGAHYTNFLTQASAALPAGFSQSVGPLPSDALIKVTFTGTQPTVNLVPVNP
jgi:hypothetical protein